MSGTLNRNRLGKVLALLASPVDGEALAAARMACKLLVAASMRPEDLAQPLADQGQCSVSELEIEARIRAMVDERVTAFVKAHDHNERQRAVALVDRLQALEEENLRLQAQLEETKPPLDWPAIVERHCRKGAKGEHWRGIEYRARTRQLTDRDKVMLRGLAEGPAPKRRRAKA